MRLPSRLTLAGTVIVAGFIVAALLAPVVAPHDPLASDLTRVLLPPDGAFLFGTDELGRDILSRILYGARLSLLEGLVSVALAMVIGVPIGMAAGYLGRAVDTVIMRCIDVLMAFPGVLLAIVAVTILGAGLANVVIAVGVYSVPIFARLARSSTLSVAAEPYIEASRAAGTSETAILYRHVLPNIAGPILVMAGLRVGVAILTASSLSFLGLGAQPPLPEWGAMLATSRNYMLIAPHLVVFPGCAIILLVLGLNLIQDGLRTALDPKLVDR